MPAPKGRERGREGDRNLEGREGGRLAILPTQNIEGDILVQVILPST